MFRIFISRILHVHGLSMANYPFKVFASRKSRNITNQMRAENLVLVVIKSPTVEMCLIVNRSTRF